MGEFRWPGFSADINQGLLDINVCCQLLNELALMLYNLIAAAIAFIYTCQNKEEICSITLITCMSSLLQRHINFILRLFITKYRLMHQDNYIYL